MAPIPGWAAAVIAGGLAACGGGPLAAGPPDASREMADAPHGMGETSFDSGDATSVDGPSKMDATGDAGDASGEGSLAADCSNQTVPPSTLECTGLYSDIATKTLAAGVQSYAPAVPLWSDGAQKARWIQLPPGTQIDTSDPNEWLFPVGTKVWKEFSKGGKRVETRLFQKVEGGAPPIWVHATYAWNADESAAVTSGGGDFTLPSDAGAYHIPTFAECDECHKGRTDHILGFEQVSLGQAGAQGLTLSQLVQAGLVSPAPAETQLTLGDDGTGAAAPALAWLHVNCGVTCHNANSNATAYGVGMRLRLDTSLLDGRTLTPSNCDSLSTTLGVGAISSGWQQPVHWSRIVPGNTNESLLVQLISNRGTNNPVGGQMPPIASSIVDTDDVAKVVEWISRMPSASAIDAGPEAATGTNGDAEADVTTGNASDAAPFDDGATQAD